MAAKKKSGKKLGKKDMKRTKGGILISSVNPSLKINEGDRFKYDLKIEQGGIGSLIIK